MNKYFLIFLAFLISTSLLFGDIFVQGTITDGQTHLPVDSARVQFVVGPDTSRFRTNSNGQYSGTVTDLPKNKVIIPNEFSVEQNYPNPFNPSTTIEFGNAYEVLDIYNILGQKIAHLDMNGREQTHQIIRDLSAGIYFYRLRDKDTGRVEQKKMILADGGRTTFNIHKQGSSPNIILNKVAGHQSIEAEMNVDKNGYVPLDSLVQLFDGTMNYVDAEIDPVPIYNDYVLQGSILDSLTQQPIAGQIILSGDLTDTLQAPTGTYSLEHQDVRNALQILFNATANGYRAKNEGHIALPGTTDVDFSLRPTIVDYLLNGRITEDGTGNPIDSAQVLSILGQDTLVNELTDSNGNYSGNFSSEELELQDVLFKVIKENYGEYLDSINVTYGSNTKDAVLVPTAQPAIVHGSSWNERAATPVDGTLNIKTLSDGTVHTAPINAQGDFSKTLNGYAGTEQVKIWLGGNADYQLPNNAIQPIGGVAAVSTIASTTQRNGADTVQVALEDIDLMNGINLYSVADSLWNNTDFRELVGYTKKWNGTNMGLINYLIDPSNNQPINQYMSVGQEKAISLFHDEHIKPNSQILVVSDTSNTANLPPDLTYTAVIFQDNSSGPGNGRFPTNEPYLNHSIAFTPQGSNYGTMISELGEGICLNDIGGSTNTVAFMLDNQGNIVFSPVGEAAYTTYFLWENQSDFRL